MDDRAEQTGSLLPESRDEVILGWREWTFLRPHYLSDRSKRDVWVPRQSLAAICDRDANHLAPVWTCSCGIYSYNTKDHLYRDIFPNGSKLVNAADTIHGQVRLWGRVLVCQTGYRAEYAYPHQLLVGVKYEHLVGWLADLYGIEVTLFDPSSVQVELPPPPVAARLIFLWS